MPTAVASSHHKERSVSIMMRRGPSLAVATDADVVDENPARTTTTMSAASSATEEKRLLKFNIPCTPVLSLARQVLERHSYVHPFDSGGRPVRQLRNR